MNLTESSKKWILENECKFFEKCCIGKFDVGFHFAVKMRQLMGLVFQFKPSNRLLSQEKEMWLIRNLFSMICTNSSIDSIDRLMYLKHEASSQVHPPSKVIERLVNFDKVSVLNYSILQSDSKEDLALLLQEKSGIVHLQSVLSGINWIQNQYFRQYQYDFPASVFFFFQCEDRGSGKKKKENGDVNDLETSSIKKYFQSYSDALKICLDKKDKYPLINRLFSTNSATSLSWNQINKYLWWNLRLFNKDTRDFFKIMVYQGEYNDVIFNRWFRVVAMFLDERGFDLAKSDVFERHSSNKSVEAVLLEMYQTFSGVSPVEYIETASRKTNLQHSEGVKIATKFRNYNHASVNNEVIDVMNINQAYFDSILLINNPLDLPEGEAGVIAASSLQSFKMETKTNPLASDLNHDFRAMRQRTLIQELEEESKKKKVKKAHLEIFASASEYQSKIETHFEKIWSDMQYTLDFMHEGESEQLEKFGYEPEKFSYSPFKAPISFANFRVFDVATSEESDAIITENMMRCFRCSFYYLLSWMRCVRSHHLFYDGSGNGIPSNKQEMSQTLHLVLLQDSARLLTRDLNSEQMRYFISTIYIDCMGPGVLNFFFLCNNIDSRKQGFKFDDSRTFGPRVFPDEFNDKLFDFFFNAPYFNAIDMIELSLMTHENSLLNLIHDRYMLFSLMDNWNSSHQYDGFKLIYTMEEASSHPISLLTPDEISRLELVEESRVDDGETISTRIKNDRLHYLHFSRIRDRNGLLRPPVIILCPFATIVSFPVFEQLNEDENEHKDKEEGTNQCPHFSFSPKYLRGYFCKNSFYAFCFWQALIEQMEEMTFLQYFRFEKK